MTPKERQARIARFLLGDVTLCLLCLADVAAPVERWKKKCAKWGFARGAATCKNVGSLCERCHRRDEAQHETEVFSTFTVDVCWCCRVHEIERKKRLSRTRV